MSVITILALMDAVTIFADVPAVIAVPENTAVPVGSTIAGPHVCIQKK